MAADIGPGTDLLKRQGGTDALDNLQGLCASCHSKKTNREVGMMAGDV